MVFSGLFQSRLSEKAQIAAYDNSSSDTVIQDGDLQYTREQANNGAAPTYQEATGAPVEVNSPLGYHVNWFTIIFLNVGQMVGTGVFSTRKLSLYYTCEDLTNFGSWINSSRSRLRRFILNLLAHWSSYCHCWFRRLPRIKLLFPKSFRKGSCVP